MNILPGAECEERSSRKGDQHHLEENKLKRREERDETAGETRTWCRGKSVASNTAEVNEDKGRKLHVRFGN